MKQFSLDQLIHFNEILGSKEVGAGGMEGVAMDPDFEQFVSFVVKKLQREQVNRLKTEEQSA